LIEHSVKGGGMTDKDKIPAAAQAVRAVLPLGFRPRAGLILGTGLGGLAGSLSRATHIVGGRIPGYPVSTASSHAGDFYSGFLAGLPVLLQAGRCHLYEGYSPMEVVMGVRLMAALDAEILIVTSAAGALNPLFAAGEIMLLDDHINFTGQSPLTGLQDEPGRSRFTDLSRIYDPGLAALARASALERGLQLREGVFIGIPGPQLESRAETRMYRQWGADAIGMSVVQEVIAARHLGLRVLGLSTLSNKNLPDCMAPASLEEIIRVSSLAAKDLEKIIAGVLEKICAASTR
jgi:purine-nucleoside phosphorylase